MLSHNPRMRQTSTIRDLVPFEVLDLALMLFRGFAGGKCSQVPATSRFIGLAGIDSVLTRFQFSNHTPEIAIAGPSIAPCYPLIYAQREIAGVRCSRGRRRRIPDLRQGAIASRIPDRQRGRVRAAHP